MTAGIPEGFTVAFLDWFRDRTEAYWSTHDATTLEQYVKAGVGGSDWQRGTRWLGGLSEDQIASVEARWDLRFPPDYRLFLRRLHSVDRPMVGAGYTASGVPGKRSRLVPVEGPSFYNWMADDEAIRGRYEWLVEGLQFDVEHNDLWRPGWGARPATLAEQKDRVRELVQVAPRLIPVFEHRYLLAEPYRAGNPVLSIWQSDIIVYGPDLRSYFLSEFADLLGLERREVERETNSGINARMGAFAAIPFWGDLLDPM